MWIDLFLTAVGVLTSTLSALLGIALLSGRMATHADRFLAGFLLATAIDLVGWTAPLMPAAVHPLLAFRLPVAFLQMPLLLAYVAASGAPGPRDRAWFAGGVALAVASVFSLMPRALGMAGIAPVWSGIVDRTDLLWNDAALHLQFYVYAAAIAARVFSSRRPLADTGLRRWLQLLLVVSLCAHTVVLARSLAAATGAWRWHAALEVIVAVDATAVLIALLLLVLLRGGVPGAASGPSMQPAPLPDTSPADAAAMARIRRIVVQGELYLDPALSLRRLARRTGLPEREVSRLINTCERMHFFDFVNSYRTRRAAALLTDPAWADRSVLEVAYATGFNSKSSFNSAFRKHQGATPSSWRGAALADSGDATASEIA